MGEEKISFWKWASSRWHLWLLLIAWQLFDIIAGGITPLGLILRTTSKLLFLLFIYGIIYFFLKPKSL